MKNFKVLLLALLLAPFSVFATIPADQANMLDGNGGSSSAPYTINLGVDTQTIIAAAEENILNYWSLVLADAGTLDISFTATNVPLLEIGINGFSVEEASQGSSASGIFTFEGLSAGDILTFIVTGTATPGGPALSTGGQAGGLYSVTTDFTVVPVPAAAWLMGTAMLGLLTVGRRRKV